MATLALLISQVESLPEESYTAEAWEAIQDTLADARAVVALGEDATPIQIETATRELIAVLIQAQLDGIKPVEVEVPVPGPTVTEQVQVPGPVVTQRVEVPVPGTTVTVDPSGNPWDPNNPTNPNDPNNPGGNGTGGTGGNGGGSGKDGADGGAGGAGTGGLGGQDGLGGAGAPGAVPPGANTAVKTTPRVKAAQTKLVLIQGKKLKIPGLVYVGAGKGKKAKFSSNNTRIAKVGSAGKITAKKVGKTKIIVRSAGAKQRVINVKVIKKGSKKVKVKKANATGIKKNMTVGQIAWAAGKYTPAKAVAAKVTYRSTASKVLGVTKVGRLLAKKAGKATVVVKVGNKTKRFKVTVKAKPVPVVPPATATTP
jgi:hypothetical protein